MTAKPAQTLPTFRVHYMDGGVLDHKDVQCLTPDAAREKVVGKPIREGIRVLKVKVVK